jgi:hypothetical protein
MEVINIIEKASCLVAGGFFCGNLDDVGSRLARAFDIYNEFEARAIL